MTTSNFNNSTVLRGLLENLGIQPFLDDKELTEIVINRPGELWTESSKGWQRVLMPDLDFSLLKKLANVFAIYNNLEISPENPICSGVMPDGQRGQVVIPSACERGTVSFVVRRPSDTRFDLVDYIKTNRLSQWVDKSTFVPKSEMIVPVSVAKKEGEEREKIEKLNAQLGIPEHIDLELFELQMIEAKALRDIERFIKLAVLNKQNFVLVGGTGSGKTTFTKAICDIVPTETRIITIEDTAELDLPLHLNRVHLFYKDVSPRTLLKSCLRMKPDRIFLTELRGDEAWDYLSTLNTGHAGSVTTVHANDCASAYYRIGSLVKQSEVGQKLDFDYIMNEIFTTLDVIIYMERTYITEIAFDPVRKNKLLNGKKA